MNNFYDYIGKSISKKEESNIWGFHVVIDASGCDKSSVDSEATINAFIQRMVNILGLLPIGKYQSYTFNDGNGRGCSSLQLISLSHLSCHTDNDEMTAYCDFFSCGKYSNDMVNKALAVVDEFFNPKRKKVVLLLRSANKIIQKEFEQKNFSGLLPGQVK